MITFYLYKIIIYMQIYIQQNKDYYFILDYCDGGTLYDYVKGGNIKKEEQIAEFSVQILQGLFEYHFNQILLKDLKPDIIGIQNNVIKLGDFDQKNEEEFYNNYYQAYEVLQNKDYDQTIDMWSFGCNVFFMKFGRSPFQKDNTAQEIQRCCIPYFDLTKIFPVVPEISSELSEFFKDIFKTKFINRIRFQSIHSHQFIQKYKKNPQVKKFIDRHLEMNMLYNYIDKHQIMTMTMDDNENISQIKQQSIAVSEIRRRPTMRKETNLGVSKMGVSKLGEMRSNFQSKIGRTLIMGSQLIKQPGNQGILANMQQQQQEKVQIQEHIQKHNDSEKEIEKEEKKKKKKEKKEKKEKKKKKKKTEEDEDLKKQLEEQIKKQQEQLNNQQLQLQEQKRESEKQMTIQQETRQTLTPAQFPQLSSQLNFEYNRSPQIKQTQNEKSRSPNNKITNVFDSPIKPVSFVQQNQPFASPHIGTVISNRSTNTAEQLKNQMDLLQQQFKMKNTLIQSPSPTKYYNNTLSNIFDINIVQEQQYQQQSFIYTFNIKKYIFIMDVFDNIEKTQAKKEIFENYNSSLYMICLCIILNQKDILNQLLDEGKRDQGFKSSNTYNSLYNTISNHIMTWRNILKEIINNITETKEQITEPSILQIIKKNESEINKFDDMKIPYRKTCYKLYQTALKRSQDVDYLRLALKIIIIHLINKIFDPENLQKSFRVYLKEQEDEDSFDFYSLIQWILRTGTNKLTEQIQYLLKVYF